jgi:class 3 adenylate cyclase
MMVRGASSMKRKIAAILAADIAGYSRLVAEDEEETLRRLESYRSVTDDFITRYGGRIFNTAGDAVLAEFPSAVEAVRCAIDIQESLRTRNMAYPTSRHMSFRIGITIGDVVERDGDLLGDGVNIAARLEGLAEVGGICISRSVHEQVANKLSVQFADIGAQEVKNIPTPIHAYMVAMRREDGTYSTPQLKKPVAAPGGPNWMWPAAVALISIVAISVGGLIYFSATLKSSTPAAAPAAAIVAATPAASAPASSAPKTQPAAATAMTQKPEPSAPSAPAPRGEKLVLETIPFVSNRARVTLANEYVPAAEHKALAISTGPIGFVTSQQSDEAAKSAAVDLCQKRAENVQPPRKCEIYAVGDTVVYPHGRPPMPPLPWITYDPSIEKPFSSKDVPLIREIGRSSLDKNYLTGHNAKAVALGPDGQNIYYFNQDTPEEAARRALESCGSVAGVPCMVVALDDVFVVPVPTTLKVIGFFHPASNSAIASDARSDAARQLHAVTGGWNAVAVGAGGRPGLALKASNELDAVNNALGNCAKQDRDCRIIAIGPFLVGPN